MSSSVLPPPTRALGARRATGTDAVDAPFWSESVERVLARVAASPRGLRETEARARLARVGPNVAGASRRATPLRLLAAQFRSPLTVLLAVAATLSIGVGERTDGSIMLGILVVSGLLGWWQEQQAAGAVERLLALVRTTSTVVRDGAAREVPSETIVPGDVVQLRAGDSVPGDALLLEACDLYVDEAALTGESFPVAKRPGPCAADASVAARTNAVFVGTHVQSGTATALVVHTGAATELGAIAAQLARRTPETEFEHGVRRFGYLLLDVATVLALVIFAVNVARERPVIDALLFTLALTVGLTPQLLPAIVSVTLARGARHLAAERVIVRRLAAIEDLGAMSVLCTDKTGTLTQGVVAVHAAEDWRGAPSDAVRRWARLNATLATGFANPIDALLVATPADDDAPWRKLGEVPYDFVRKRQSVAAARAGRSVLVTKGALGTVLDACASVEDAAGARRPLDDAVRAAIVARHEALARDGHRCLGVAWRTLADDAPIDRAAEVDLVFAGILSLADPVKPGAADALRALAEAGVRVKMITGDDRHVARRIAQDVGLAVERVVTGSDLRAMSTAALAAAASRVDVFAEIDPNQKEHVILALRHAGHAVGFLGDGINDAAALHAADVGISVESASDVTKAAAAIVLLDKDLGVLARGVREGRRAFANTLKYVFITTSANFGNMVSMAIASLFSAFLPMLPKQVLLLNVLTDLPAMAIATDRADPEQTARPRRWNTAAIRRFMLVFGLVSSAFDLLTFALLRMLSVGAEAFRTAWFLESVLSELLILLVVRTRRPFARSPIGPALAWATAGVGAAVLVLPVLPFARALGFAPLPGELLALVVAIVLAYAATSELVKRSFYRRPV